MDVAVVIVMLVAVAVAASVVWSLLGRSGPSDVLAGLFVAPTLGWPHGVQEEDRERAWVPSPGEADGAGAPAGGGPGDAPSAEVVDVETERAPLRRVR